MAGSAPWGAAQIWDDAHARNRWIQNSVAGADAEVALIDSLLVTRKHPRSLAKFLSTSDVFSKRCADAQEATAGIALVKSFGWAPQRFSSRDQPPQT